MLGGLASFQKRFKSIEADAFIPSGNPLKDLSKDEIKEMFR